jgi:cytochrome c oxidase cbb3-type subunit 3
MNNHFLRFLLLVCLIAPECHALQMGGSLVNPFFVFEDGLGGQPPEAQAALAKEVGFEGISFDGAKLMPERLNALDEHGLQLFFLYLGVNVGGPQVEYEPGFDDAIAKLKGRSTIIWLTIRGDGPQAEERAVEAARRVSDLAAASNLRVALYPHYGLYVQTARDALRIAEKAGRSNLGITFNLCHELRSGSAIDVKNLLSSALPRLYAVSINGADPQGDWDRLIQPLDRGSVDVAGLVRTLVENGYRGPIGLQCYAIKGDPRTNLQRSMAVWRRISAQAASGSAPPAIGEPTPNEPRSQANDAAGVLTGEPIFKKNCSFCHGAEGLGASGPSLAGSSLVKNDTNGDLIGSLVHNGRAAKGMPGFSFSDTDTMALVQYLHLLSERATNSDGKLVSDEKRLTVGDLHAGQSYFAGPGRCGSCHSPLGDLKGIGSKYTPRILEERLVYPGGSRPSVRVTTLQGDVLSGELIHLDEFSLILRDKTGRIRSLNRKTVKVELTDPLAAHRKLLDELTDADIHNLLAYLETL